jgi:arylformamidase
VAPVTDLEREYSPSSRVGGTSLPFIDDYVVRSAAAAEILGERVQVLPGGTRLVVAGPGAPLLVFVHGGYWQALDAESSMYLAPQALAHGWSYAAVEYTLAPDADLPTMVRQCRASLAALGRQGEHGPVVLAGHSAGAHLAAMSALVAASSLPVDRVVLLSGVFDLRPLVHTTVNDPLGLDDDAAAAVSPALLPVERSDGGGPPAVMVAVGESETDAFHAQSHVYAARLRLAGLAVTELVCAGRHHFDIVDDLVDPASDVGAFTLRGVS